MSVARPLPADLYIISLDDVIKTVRFVITYPFFALRNELRSLMSDVIK